MALQAVAEGSGGNKVLLSPLSVVRLQGHGQKLMEQGLACMLNGWKNRWDGVRAGKRNRLLKGENTFWLN